MKYSAVIITTIFCSTYLLGQPKEQDFLRTLSKVVAALSKRDSVTLSEYTDKKNGIYILNRIGIFDTYQQVTTLGFSDSRYPYAPFYDGVKLTPLVFAKLPKFDCEKWTKTGTFVDTSHTDHLLSMIAKNINKESNGKIPEKKINEFYSLENKSRRVVIAANDGNELIIYLSFINDKWVLSIIDKVTCDCSV